MLAGLAYGGDAMMAQFVPLWATTGVTGFLLGATILLYLPEIRSAGQWLVSFRTRRIRAIAREVRQQEKEEENREKATAIVRAFRSRKDDAE